MLSQPGVFSAGLCRWRINTLVLYPLAHQYSQMGTIGYAFLVDETYGFVTLATYFLCLGATAYSYRKVGHGQRGQRIRGRSQNRDETRCPI